MEFLTRRDTLVSLPHVLNSGRVNSSSKLWISSTSMTPQVHTWINHQCREMSMACEGWKFNSIWNTQNLNFPECIRYPFPFWICNCCILYVWAVLSELLQKQALAFACEMWLYQYVKCDCACSVVGYFLCLSCQKSGSWQMLQENIAALTFTNIKNPSKL